MSVEVIITIIKIRFDYSDWKLLSVFFKCANSFGLPPALGELLACRCRTNYFPKLKTHELILKWKRGILANDSRNISWRGVGFLWVLKKELFFSLGKLKEYLWASSNVCGQIRGTGWGAEGGLWYVCVSSCFLKFQLNSVSFFPNSICGVVQGYSRNEFLCWCYHCFY